MLYVHGLQGYHGCPSCATASLPCVSCHWNCLAKHHLVAHQVLPVVLLGALALARIQEARQSRHCTAAHTTGVVDFPRPLPASSAARTQLRPPCAEARAKRTQPNRAQLSGILRGSPTARGAVPESLELSSSVTTALEAGGVITRFGLSVSFHVQSCVISMSLTHLPALC